MDLQRPWSCRGCCKEAESNFDDICEVLLN